MAAEKTDTEELTKEQNDTPSAPDPPENSTTSTQEPPNEIPTSTNQDQDKGQDKSTKPEHTGPVHERCVHGEINAISYPLDISEVYFTIAHPFELLPLSKYYFCEWSEAEHLFKPAVDFDEEMYSDWSSPSPSPTHSAIGL